MFGFKRSFKPDSEWHQINSQTRQEAQKRNTHACTQSNQLNRSTRTKKEWELWHRSYWSWGNWQDQLQASVLHMACHFHSFHKDNTKSVISHYLGLKKNKIPDMLNLLNIMEQRRWGKRSSLCLRTGGVDHSLGWTGQRPLTKPSPPPSDSMRCQSEWLSAPVKPDGSFTLNKWMDLRATRL